MYFSPRNVNVLVVLTILWMVFGLLLLFSLAFLSSVIDGSSAINSSGILVLAGIDTIFVVLLFFIHRRLLRQAKFRRIWVEAETPRWQTAMTIWQCLYYC